MSGLLPFYVIVFALPTGQRVSSSVLAVAADPATSAGVKVAMVMGAYYESSGKHIGRPYVDKLMNLPDASFACGFLRVFGGHVDAVYMQPSTATLSRASVWSQRSEEILSGETQK